MFYGSDNSCGVDSASCPPKKAVKTNFPSTVKVVGKTGVCDIVVPMWDTIGCAEDNIVRLFDKGDCVCFEGLYYFSKKDENVSKPTNTENWTKGYTRCELLKPLDGEALCELISAFEKPAEKVGTKDLVLVSSADGCSLKALSPHSIVTSDDNSVTVVAKTGEDGAITYDLKVVHPDDVKVTDLAISGNDITITLSDGTSFTKTITHPAGTTDVKLTDATIDTTANTITYTFSDGTSFTKPHPAGGAGASITNIEHVYNNATGELTVTSSDGSESAPQNSHEAAMYPSGQWKCIIPVEAADGSTPAADPLLFKANVKRTAGYGMIVDASTGEIKISKEGIYLIDLRGSTSAVAATGGSDKYILRMSLKPSGGAYAPLHGLEALARDGNVGERVVKTRHMSLPLDVGDTLTVQIVATTGVLHVDGFEGRIAFQSSKP